MKTILIIIGGFAMIGGAMLAANFYKKEPPIQVPNYSKYAESLVLQASHGQDVFWIRSEVNLIKALLEHMGEPITEETPSKLYEMLAEMACLEKKYKLENHTPEWVSFHALPFHTKQEIVTDLLNILGDRHA